MPALEVLKREEAALEAIILIDKVCVNTRNGR